MEALQRLHNRGSISTGYEIDNSCKFEDDNDEYLYRTNASGTNRKTWTVSWWFKQTEVPSTRSSYVEHWQGGVYGEAARAGIDNNDRLWIDVGGGAGNTGTLFRSLSSARLRDTAAWYHVVIACDSTQSTEADRLKVWLNGVEVTAWDQKQYPTLNFGSALAGFAGIQMKWGSADATYHGYSGYLAECNYVDGVTATQNDFGEFDDDSGIWKPKEYEGSYGTNGSYLDFKIASDLGANAKGNDVNFSLNNITSADQATDTPTNNFAHWNPLMAYDGNEGRSEITEGGTTLKNSNTGNGSSNGWYGGAGTIPVTSGKWYWEYQPFAGTFGYHGVGIMGADFISDDVDDIRDYCPNLYLRNGATPTIYQHLQSGNNTAYKTMTSWTSNSSDIFAIALNMDDEEITFYRNGTAITENGTSNTTFSISSVIAQSSPIIFHYQSYANGTGIYFNFGGYTEMSISSAASDANGYGTFEYAPPSGYYALCTKNLAEYG